MLAPPNRRELLLLENFHHSMLEGLANQDFKYRLDLSVEVEELTMQDLRSKVHTDFRRKEEGRLRPVKQKIRLGLRLEFHNTLCELIQVRVCLNVSVLPTEDGLWGTGALRRRVGPHQATSLRFALLCDLGRVLAGQDESSVRAPSDDTAIGLNVDRLVITIRAASGRWPWLRRKLVTLVMRHLRHVRSRPTTGERSRDP